MDLHVSPNGITLTINTLQASTIVKGLHCFIQEFIDDVHDDEIAVRQAENICLLFENKTGINGK